MYSVLRQFDNFLLQLLSNVSNFHNMGNTLLLQIPMVKFLSFLTQRGEHLSLRIIAVNKIKITYII